MRGAHVVEALTTREMLVQFHGGAGVERGAEVGSGPGGMGTSACVAVDAEFFQGGREVGTVMLPKHVHLDLGLESVN